MITVRHRRKAFRSSGPLEVLFVVSSSSSPTTDESSLETDMTTEGFNVTLLSDSDAVGDETGYDVVVLTSQGSTAQITDKYLSNTSGVVDLDYATWADMNFCNSVGNDTGEDSIDSENDSFAIPTDAGVSGSNIQVFNNNSSGANVRYTTNDASGATDVFNSPGNTGRNTVFVFESGASLTSGTAAGRRVAFGIGDSNSMGELNATGIDIFLSCVKWAGGQI